MPYQFHSARFPPPQRSVLDIQKAPFPQPSLPQATEVLSILPPLVLLPPWLTALPYNHYPSESARHFQHLLLCVPLCRDVFTLARRKSVYHKWHTTVYCKNRVNVTFKHQRDKEHSAKCCLVMTLLTYCNLFLWPWSLPPFLESSVCWILMRGSLI